MNTMTALCDEACDEGKVGEKPPVWGPDMELLRTKINDIRRTTEELGETRPIVAAIKDVRAMSSRRKEVWKNWTDWTSSRRCSRTLGLSKHG